MADVTVPRQVVIVMGVSGSGKTSIAVPLAERLGWPFQEGDDLHPAANVAKMHAGHALDDADRWPWLDAIAAWIDARLAAGGGGVVTCSALKRAYRDRLVGDRRAVRLVFLHADRALLADRLARRVGHFMPASLLDSQLATLEPPAPEEHAIVVEIALPPEQVVTAVLEQLRTVTDVAPPTAKGRQLG
jgi:carbohydrate kinase (thermoresistant glucokinase family)